MKLNKNQFKLNILMYLYLTLLNRRQMILIQIKIPYLVLYNTHICTQERNSTNLCIIHKNSENLFTSIIEKNHS
jgi:hypothetical protein